MSATPPRDMDSDIPRVNLDDYRDLAEPAEPVAAQELYAGQLAAMTPNGAVPFNDDGLDPDMVLVVLPARQRGMEWGDTYPGGQDVKTPLVRGEGGYLNLPLAAGETVTAYDDYLTPAGGGEVRAGTLDADGNPADHVLGTPVESIDNSGGTESTAVATEVHF